VTLSNSKVNYMGMSEALKVIHFIFYILRGMKSLFQSPIMVRTDNIGATFMAESASPGARIRGIKNSYHFVRNNVEDGFIKISFLKQTTMIQTFSPRMSRRMPTRDV
jgi:hypothetical protein